MVTSCGVSYRWATPDTAAGAAVVEQVMAPVLAELAIGAVASEGERGEIGDMEEWGANEIWARVGEHRAGEHKLCIRGTRNIGGTPTQRRVAVDDTVST
jgi:hypothetical protein